MSQGCWDGLFQKLMVAGGGNNNQNLSEAVSYRYLGYPVVIDQPLPTGGTVNNTAMFHFGDLGMACRMGSRRDIRIIISGDRHLEYDQGTGR